MSNRAPQTDAREAACLGKRSQPRAVGRERWHEMNHPAASSGISSQSLANTLAASGGELDPKRSSNSDTKKINGKISIEDYPHW